MKTRTLALLVVVSLTSVGSAALADAPCKSATGDVRVPLGKNTTFKDVVMWGMSFTCKNIVIDPRITKAACPVAVTAPATLSASDAYDLFLATLHAMGFTVVPRGTALRIISEPVDIQPAVVAAVYRRQVAPHCKPLTLEFPTRVSP